MMETTSHEDFIKIPLTLWATWRARRKAIHEENFQALYSFVTRLISDPEITGTMKNDKMFNEASYASRLSKPSNTEDWTKNYLIP